MKITRRNALIGLGSVVVGSGALVGSGAFSSVEADRTISISTNGDSSAALSLSPGTGAAEIISSETEGDTSDSIITLDKSDLNADAKTTFSAALEVNNNDDQAVGFWVSEDTSQSAELSSTGVLQFENSSGTSVVESNPSTANETLAADTNSGEKEQITIIVDTTQGDPENLPSNVTLNADSSAAGTP